MTDFPRKLLGVVVLLALLAPMAVPTPVSAQGALDGAACWPAGSLSIDGAQMTWPAAPATIIDPAGSYQAKLETTAGEILIQLDPAGAPLATNNFVCLALAGYFSGTDFHRIFADTLIQGGDPTATGLGGPGYTIPSDPTVGSYPIGSVAMANALPDQNGSQFFIAATDLTGLIPDQYPVFGQVIGGMDVVQTISAGQVTATVSDEMSKPVDPSVLLSVQIIAGTPSGGPAGPSVTTPIPTATTAAAEPTTTPVAGAGGVQSRPLGPGGQPTQPAPTIAATEPAIATTETPASAPPTQVVVVPGCDGLEEYQTAFDDAYFQTALDNGDALAFLMALQNSESSDSMFEQMTAEQAAAMSAFYSALADAIALITPPPFAAEWHAVQIEIFKALGDFTGNIASQGLTIASMQASPILLDLTDQSDAALQNAVTACPEFQAWATGEATDEE